MTSAKRRGVSLHEKGLSGREVCENSLGFSYIRIVLS